MKDARDFMVGMLIGGMIGAAAALMYAPMAGTETRRLLKEKATEAAEKTTRMTEEARMRAAQLAEEARMRTSEMAHQAQSKVGELTGQVKTKVGEVTTRGRELVEHQREAIAAAVEAGKQAYQEKQTELKQEVEESTAPAIPSA